MKILLVEPSFPILHKSKNHGNFLPIGLLKIASYYREQGHQIKLVRGNVSTEIIRQIGDSRWYVPDKVLITSLFTYWADHVRESVQHYRKLYPNAKIIVGGIYASLLLEQCKKFTGCDQVFKGVFQEAERYFPAYDLIKEANPHPIDYQIVHTTRGCPRKCPFCGTWIIEPEFKAKKSIKNEIKYRKIIFYDNNLLMNPYIENILKELIELRKEGKIEWVESQSGFDGRVLLEKPYLAKMIREAGFRYPRIAWDWGYEEHPIIKKQIDLLKSAGYSSKEIYVFMLYNWDIPFEEMEKKRIKCWEWKVQIADCRYRPLDQLFDNYNPRVIGQTKKDYYIHEKAGWTDVLIKQFRKNVREQNICVRHNFPFYSRSFEHKKFAREIRKKVKELKDIKDKIKFLESIGADYWIPDRIRYPRNNSLS